MNDKLKELKFYRFLNYCVTCRKSKDENNDICELLDEMTENTGPVCMEHEKKDVLS